MLNSDPEDLFEKQHLIGEGSFGKVYKGVNRETGQIVAIKIIDLKETEDDIDDIQKEIKMLSQLDSEFITKYYGSYLQDSCLWIIMEYCGGGSALDLASPGPIDEVYCAIILKQVLKGIDYLHEQGKLHRDIKAANVLLCQDGAVKLADFGVSGQITSTVQNKLTFVGK